MKSVIIILLINILFFISANILAQEKKYLLNTRGELVPVSVVEKYVKPQYNDNLKRNIFGDILFDPNDQTDTLGYRQFFTGQSVNFGFYGQDVMIQWFVAPVDMRIVSVGMMCVAKDDTTTAASVKLVKFDWTMDEISNFPWSHAGVYLGYYEAVGGGYSQITAYLDNPDRTGPWVDSSGVGYDSPFGHDLWSNNGLGIPFVPVIDAGTIPENYNWVDMDTLFEPEVLRYDVIGVSTRNLDPIPVTPGQPEPPNRIGWYANENTGLGGTFKFYLGGRIRPSLDIGWWARDFIWDYVMVVVLTGDVPPSINSYTIIPSGIVSGPLIIDANITDTNPGDTTNAGVAGASIYFSNDSGMVWTEILMSGSEPDFTGEIPPQSPGSTVYYKILATDINGNVATSLITTFYIFPPSGAKTLIVFNGLNGVSGYPQDYYFGVDIQNGLASFDHDTWSYGALQEELAELYDNIFEFCTEGPKDYNDSVITNWLAADGSRNYFLAGQEWLGLKNDFRDSIYVAGDFEYDILGVTRSYNNVSFNGTSGQELPTLVFPQEMTLFGGPLFELFNANLTDSMQYDPYTIINVDNRIDAFGVLPVQDIDMTVETRGINGIPSIHTLPSQTHRVLPGGNKIVFLSYDPLSLDSSPDSIWYGFTNENTPYQTLLWFDILAGVEMEEKEVVPEKFKLYQNYPNPFNPTTNINYQLPVKSFVALKVYDVLGNEIATVVNEEKPAGSYEVDFDATELTSGVYFYRLRTGEFVETKKMVLLK